jgi:nucleotide-binding universal stress UspA family protein
MATKFVCEAEANNMTEYIVVPLDGSALSESVLPVAVTLARVTSTGITVLRSVRQGSKEKDSAEEYLYKIRERLEGEGLPVSTVRTVLVEDEPAPAIVGYTEQEPSVWLIAMTTHHLNASGTWASGSVAASVLKTAHKPVLLVRPSTEMNTGNRPVEQTADQILAHQRFGRIVVPLDSSAFAEGALREARRLALLTGATLALICVVPPPDTRAIEALELIPTPADTGREYEIVRLRRYLLKMAEQLQSEGLQVLTELTFGHPAETVLLAARRLHGDLIVMAAHGRRDRERLWLGSVAQKLVLGSTLPVLLVRGLSSNLSLLVDAQ